MANRIRNERLEIKLTKEEKTLFEEKKKLAKCGNMSYFIRKCVLKKKFIRQIQNHFEIYRAYLEAQQTTSISLVFAKVLLTVSKPI